MKLTELQEIMRIAGFVLPRKKHSLQEAKAGVNPKTGGMMFLDEHGRLWSFDRREQHFDVLDRSGVYFKLNETGQLLGSSNSSIAYSH